MTTATWKPEYSSRAQEIFREYSRHHDLSDLKGKIAAVDPESGRIWIGDSGIDVAEQTRSQGVRVPVYLFRIGHDHFVRKGRR